MRRRREKEKKMKKKMKQSEKGFGSQLLVIERVGAVWRHVWGPKGAVELDDVAVSIQLVDNLRQECIMMGAGE